MLWIKQLGPKGEENGFAAGRQLFSPYQVDCESSDCQILLLSYSFGVVNGDPDTTLDAPTTYKKRRDYL